MPPAALPTTFAPMEDLTDAPIGARRTIVFSEDAAGNLFINGKVFDPNRVDVRARLNTVEEWTIRNTSGEQHPLHIHTNDFQVMTSMAGPTGH